MLKRLAFQCKTKKNVLSMWGYDFFFILGKLNMK